MLSAEQPKVKVSSAGIPFQLLTLPYHSGSQQPTQDSFIHLVPIQAPTSADHRTFLHKPMSPFLLCSRGRQDPERWSQLNWNTSPQGAALAACTDHACVVARCLEVSQQPASLLTGLPIYFVCIIRSFGTTQWSPRELCLGIAVLRSTCRVSPLSSQGVARLTNPIPKSSFLSG